MYKILLAAAVVCGLVAPLALAGDAISVTDPYARAVPPGQPNSAVFMQIRNDGADDRALLFAASAVSEVVELHTHRMEDGMMKMRRVDQVALPAGETVTLAPGGLHVMLIGLKRQLQPGDDVPLTLTLDDGSELSLTAPVRNVMPMGQTSELNGEPMRGRHSPRSPSRD
jgi:periplasmic copper chaperone A